MKQTSEFINTNAAEKGIREAEKRIKLFLGARDQHNGRLEPLIKWNHESEAWAKIVDRIRIVINN